MPKEMTVRQFDVVADFIQSREPVRTAMRMILVHGKSNTEARDKTGMALNSIWNALARYRLAHEKVKKIVSAYGEIAP